MERQSGLNENKPFNLPISRQEMGELVGLSPETISRQLKDLISLKVIKLEHKRLTILDLTQLKAIAQA
jgi:CRP/FNR family transcriptional regulator